MPTSPSLQPKRRVRAKATAKSAPRLQKGKARARMGTSPKEEPSDLPNQRSGTLHPATASNTGKMAIVPNEIVANAPMSIPRFAKHCLTRGSVKPKSETRRLLEVGHPHVHLKEAATPQINPSATKVLEPPPTNLVLPAQHLTETTTSLGLRRAEDEALIDAVTGVSGSGPAYVFHLVEAMAAAGIAAGLAPDLAMQLARETVAGSGELLARSTDPAATLRENVTSPGGTTAAALDILMAEDGLTALMTRAILRATERSRELAG